LEKTFFFTVLLTISLMPAERERTNKSAKPLWIHFGSADKR